MTEQCKDCKYLYNRKVSNPYANSECRRFPPTAINNKAFIAPFPNVEHHYWCGEFKRADKED